MAFPPFSATIIPEYDTVSSQPTWLVKFDGVPVARVVEVEGLSFRDAEYRILTDDFQSPPPWAAGSELPAHPTARIAIMAVIEEHLLTKEVQLRAG